jgi:hypothetical protein
MLGSESDWKMALHNHYNGTKPTTSVLDPRRHSIQVGSSQVITLNDRPASSQQQQYYLGGNTTKNGSNRYGAIGALLSGGSPRKKGSLPVEQQPHLLRRNNAKMEMLVSSGCSGGVSSSTSSSVSSAGYKSHYRFTLPSITTTTSKSKEFTFWGRLTKKITTHRLSFRGEQQ